MTEKKFQNGSYKVDDVTNYVKNWPFARILQKSEKKDFYKNWDCESSGKYF